MKNLIIPGFTANAALAASIMASALPAPYNPNAELGHGSMTTANASLFVQAHFSEPLTIYATGWRDGAGLEALCEFLAPTLPGTGERYEHTTYPNAESFLSDVRNDDYTSALARMSSTYQADHSAAQLESRVAGIHSLADHNFSFLASHEDHEDDRVTVEGSVYGPDGEAPVAFEVSQVNGYWYVDLVAVEGRPLE